MKITDLTKNQKDLFPKFVRKWTEIGLCTRPADRLVAEDGVRLAYKIAELEPPTRIVWCGSPLSLGLTKAIIFGLKDQGDSVWDSVGDSVWDSVGDSVRASVWDSVRASVRDSVRASVGDSVWASVGDSVYGQHDAGWLSFYDYFREAVGMSEETQKLVGIWQVAKSAGWWLPYKHICWISERPNNLKIDDRGRLHCETGPAISYPDGWSIWAWHGVKVEQYLIEQPSKITELVINEEKNAEIRRVMIARYGFDRYLKDGSFILEQQDDFGKLYRKKINGELDLVFVKVVNSTPEPDETSKEYILPCRSTVKSAHEAVAQSFGLTTKEYVPSFES